MGDYITCPICGSKRIIRARHDTDWGGRAHSLVNPDICYPETDLIDAKNEQLYGDIDIYICNDCVCIWDRNDSTAIAALRARIEELTIPDDIREMMKYVLDFYHKEVAADVVTHDDVNRALDWLTAYKEAHDNE
jgi:hypothetical protein